MPSLASVSVIDFPYKISQEEAQQCAKEVFMPSFPDIERMLGAFKNTEIQTRNFCKPLDYYKKPHTFGEQNAEYIRLSLEYSIKAIEACIASTQLKKEAISDIIFVSSTGLATPSLDSLIINAMRLNQHINRTPVFGLGCAGGVSGFSKASLVAKANRDAVVLLVSLELCSLTFLRNDYSKSNFIGSSLFSDGVAACIITGDNHKNNIRSTVSVLASQSKLYYDSLDVMGWEFLNEGFKVLFSQDIPAIITKKHIQRYHLFFGKAGITTF